MLVTSEPPAGFTIRCGCRERGVLVSGDVRINSPRSRCDPPPRPVDVDTAIDRASRPPRAQAQTSLLGELEASTPSPASTCFLHLLPGRPRARSQMVRYLRDCRSGRRWSLYDGGPPILSAPSAYSREVAGRDRGRPAMPGAGHQAGASRLGDVSPRASWRSSASTTRGRAALPFESCCCPLVLFTSRISMVADGHCPLLISGLNRMRPAGIAPARRALARATGAGISGRGQSAHFLPSVLLEISYRRGRCAKAGRGSPAFVGAPSRRRAVARGSAGRCPDRRASPAMTYAVLPVYVGLPGDHPRSAPGQEEKIFKNMGAEKDALHYQPASRLSGTLARGHALIESVLPGTTRSSCLRRVWMMTQAYHCAGDWPPAADVPPCGWPSRRHRLYPDLDDSARS